MIDLLLALLLLGQTVIGLNMKTAIFLLFLIGMSLAPPAETSSESTSNSSERSTGLGLIDLLRLLKALGLLQPSPTPAPATTAPATTK
ncbi:hypothetical protein AGOR_G00191370 [Albula goreensis]|uniref:Uncharacterized protein n=1 Tax=Albula goreensis TaxID=1534307 RepID=A0A8T3CU67_9TELE|nr:hypothetical protein AGOR_G00191370 [Albula goreensis]